MKADALITATIEIRPATDETMLIRSKRRWQVWLFASAAAAAVTAALGLALSAASLFRLISNSGTLSTAASILLAVSFPLLLCAAHCLDRIDELKTAIRVMAYRRTLLQRIKH